MTPPVSVRLDRWQALLHRLEDAFGVTVPANFQQGAIDLEALLRDVQALQPDPGKPGQFVITYELKQELARQLGISPTEITDTTALAPLLPDRVGRRQAMLALQSQVDWKLPRIGLPIWAQYVWGAGLLLGFILQFIYPVPGMILFFGGMLLSFQVEKLAWAFQYPTFGKWVARVVELNWPTLQLGTVDTDRLRAAYADALETELGLLCKLDADFGQVLVQNAWLGWGPQVHLLNGDHLRLTLEELEIPGDRIVMRECMCMGSVQPQADFFEQRAAFIHLSYNADPAKYQQWVMAELLRLEQVPADTELNLWFEEDLFCQANLWFLLDRLAQSGRRAHTYLVLPSLPPAPRLDTGFAKMSGEALAEALRQRIPLTEKDFALGQNLWRAFQAHDLTRLQALTQSLPPHWRCLPEIVQAHIDRAPDAEGLSKPHRILQAILAEGHTEFEAILGAFTERASIYGYGDLQVKALIEEIKGDQDK